MAACQAHKGLQKWCILDALVRLVSKGKLHHDDPPGNDMRQSCFSVTKQHMLAICTTGIEVQRMQAPSVTEQLLSGDVQYNKHFEKSERTDSEFVAFQVAKGYSELGWVDSLGGSVAPLPFSKGLE